MRCEDFQEAWSARLDGEPVDVPSEAIDAHVAGCEDCAAFTRGAEQVHRTVRIRGAEAVPDLAPAILAAAPAPVPAPALSGPAVAPPVREWARYALLAIALTQLVLATPAFLLGDQAGATTHLARELGSWDLALAVAWLVVAWSPKRAAGLIPFAAALALVMAGTAVVDVAAGRVPALSESHHLLDVIGVALVWVLARSTPSSRPLLPRLASPSPS